jgi:hypothetical protein
MTAPMFVFVTAFATFGAGTDHDNALSSSRT